jgi:hypothetical protein
MGAGASQAELSEEVRSIFEFKSALITIESSEFRLLFDVDFVFLQDIIARNDLALRRFRSKTSAQKLFQDAETLFKRLSPRHPLACSSSMLFFKTASQPRPD